MRCDNGNSAAYIDTKTTKPIHFPRVMKYWQRHWLTTEQRIHSMCPSLANISVCLQSSKTTLVHLVVSLFSVFHFINVFNYIHDRETTANLYTI